MSTSRQYPGDLFIGDREIAMKNQKIYFYFCFGRSIEYKILVRETSVSYVSHKRENMGKIKHATQRLARSPILFIVLFLDHKDKAVVNQVSPRCGQNEKLL